MYLDQYGIVRFQFFWGAPKTAPKKAKNSKKPKILKTGAPDSL